MISLQTLFKHPEQHLHQTVQVGGWLRSLRKTKNFSFAVLSDGTHAQHLQIILDKSLPNYAELEKMIAGYALMVKGLLVTSQGKGQGLEMQAQEVEILGSVDEQYPLQKKATSLEFLRDVAHLRPRTNTMGAVFRIRHGLSFATHQFFHTQGFYYVHTPIITASDCEGAGELFTVSTLPSGKSDYTQDFFGKQTYLTVSGQLSAETLATGMSKVYTFGPTFRSENSNTPRHLAEFWMVEPELAFADLPQTTKLAQDYLKFIFCYVLENHAEDLAFLEKHYETGLQAKLEKVCSQPFQSVTYNEAMKLLEQSGESFEFPVGWGKDLQTEHERYLAEKHFQCPVIVTDYPSELKSFYMKENDDGQTVAAFDVLVPGVGEIIGGSQREHRLDVLERRMQAAGLDLAEYSWYLDLRRFGTVPHAGFGLGLERAVMYATGMSNIRDVIPFPRTPRNAAF